MPLFTGHGLAGVASAYYFEKDRLHLPKAALCILSANLPDFDYIPGILMGAPKRFHPSFTHSFFAAAAFTLIVYGITKNLPRDERRSWTWALGIAYTSHLFLDIIQVDNYLTNGVGVPLFYPFTNRCYQTGWNLLPTISSFVDFSNISGLFQSLLSSKFLRYLLHEQLVLGGMVGIVFGIRRLFYYKKTLAKNPRLLQN